MGIYAARFLVYSLQSSPVELGSPYIRLTTFPSSHVASSVSLHLMFVPEFVIDNAPFAQQLLFALFRRSIWIQAFHFHLFRLRFGLPNAFGPCAILEVLRPRLFFFLFGCLLPCSTTLYHKVFDISIVLRIIIKQDIILCAILLDNSFNQSYNASVQQYHSCWIRSISLHIPYGNLHLFDSLAISEIQQILAFIYVQDFI